MAAGAFPPTDDFERDCTWCPYKGSLCPDVKDQSRKVAEDLVYLPLIESGFNATAYSRARASGLWQFVPNTARIYGLDD